MHLDPLELDEVRAGEADPPHLRECADCRAAVARLSALAERLRPRVFVPARVDRAVLGRRTHWKQIAAALLAAALATALFTMRPEEKTFARSDVNRDGTVDIIDAYLTTLRGGDGDAIARQCVSLRKS
jgi:hypothetical protein